MVVPHLPMPLYGYIRCDKCFGGIVDATCNARDSNRIIEREILIAYQRTKN